MTGPAVRVTEDGQDPGPSRLTGPGIGRGAALIAVITVLARLAGLLRTIVFAKTVGATCPGTACTTASTLPNIVYDVVLGGALTSIMVPVLARPAAASALVTVPGRRLGAPALAPVSSSIVAYLAFVPLGRGQANALAGVPLSAEDVLAAGTTAGVAVLAGLVAAGAFGLVAVALDGGELRDTVSRARGAAVLR